MVDSDGCPYVTPMNFGYNNGVIYMRSAQEGSSIGILEKKPNVCITFCTESEVNYRHEQVACSYYVKSTSVLCRGKVVFIGDLEQKIEALNHLMKQLQAGSLRILSRQ